MKAPNISSWRRRTVGDLTATLDLGRPDTTLPPLPPTRDDPAYLASKGCSESDLAEVATDQPPYPLPSVQHMPVQETSGTGR